MQIVFNREQLIGRALVMMDVTYCSVQWEWEDDFGREREQVHGQEVGGCILQVGGEEGLRDERRKGRNFPPASYVTCVGTGLSGFDLKFWISSVRFWNEICFMHLGTTLKRKGNVWNASKCQNALLDMHHRCMAFEWFDWKTREFASWWSCKSDTVEWKGVFFSRNACLLFDDLQL